MTDSVGNLIVRGDRVQFLYGGRAHLGTVEIDGGDSPNGA